MVQSLLPVCKIQNLQYMMLRADDARITEIVTMLDALPERGAADALLCPLRDRLQQVWPPRSLNFGRLLFTPASFLVVSGAQWRRHSVTIPRTALRCLASQVRNVLDDAADIDGEIAGATTADRTGLLRGGAKLWPRAAEILASSNMPGDWAAQTNLTDSDYIAIARPLAVLLREGLAIETWMNEVAAGALLPRAQLRDCLARAACLADTARAPAQHLGMLIGVLLARMPSPEDVLMAAGDLAQISQDKSIRTASDLAIDVALSCGLASLVEQSDIGLAAIELRRLQALLDTLDHPGPAARPARKQELAGLRRNLDAACRRRFDRKIQAVVNAAQSNVETQPTDNAIAMLEGTMRDLRDFEAVARCFGHSGGYDGAIAAATQKLASLPHTPQSRCNVARLIEILDGPEAGLAYLAGRDQAPAARGTIASAGV